MDQAALANYAYHNCEFRHAIAIATQAPLEATAAAVMVKAFTELDEKDEALCHVARYVQAFPGSGLLHYLHGVSLYLARKPLQEIEACFAEAARLDHPGGDMGLAFVDFAAKRYKMAARRLGRARTEGELEHNRLSMLFQVEVAAQNLATAEEHLKAADLILRQKPSLLRHYWGQLCWVRLLRAKGRFDGARVLLETTMDQISPDMTPRLYRNAVEARRMIDERRDDHNIIVPFAASSGASKPRASSPLDMITRKPMLHSLFIYLSANAGKGATKEEIVQHVWQESYNPLIHDDRIYKAIGRLRKLIGDDIKAPRYLTQVGRHYVLTLPAKPESVGES